MHSSKGFGLRFSVYRFVAFTIGRSRCESEGRDGSLDPSEALSRFRTEWHPACISALDDCCSHKICLCFAGWSALV